MKYDLILKRAYEHGKSQHPDAPSAHHAAFANSVACAMTGMSGGYGGPSMREHLAEHLVIEKFGGGINRCTFEQTIELLDECCYGELTLRHALMLGNGHCFDDAPGEVEIARSLLATA